jgi:hypothetical protein
MDDGEIVSIGSYYPNQTGSGIPFACFDKDATVFTCISLPPAGVDFVGFIFSISGNSIDNGFFATASSIEGVFDGFKNPQYPITGSRGGTTTTTTTPTPPEGAGPESSEANFDDVTNELTIPVLYYNGSKYSVVLENEGNFGKLLFSVKEAKQLN